MPRNITFLALIQLIFIVVGFITLGIVMKLNGYGIEGYDSLRWKPLSLFLRKYGLILLLVPITWTCGAVYAYHNPKARVSFSVCLVIGIVLCIVICALFSFASMSPFTRPLITAQ